MTNADDHFLEHRKIIETGLKKKFEQLRKYTDKKLLEIEGIILELLSQEKKYICAKKKIIK